MGKLYEQGVDRQRRDFLRVDTSCLYLDSGSELMILSSAREHVWVSRTGWTKNWLQSPDFEEQQTVQEQRTTGGRTGVVMRVQRTERQLFFRDHDLRTDTHSFVFVPRILEVPLLKLMIDNGLDAPLPSLLPLETQHPLQSLSSILLQPR